MNYTDLNRKIVTWTQVLAWFRSLAWWQKILFLSGTLTMLTSLGPHGEVERQIQMAFGLFIAWLAAKLTHH